MAVGQSQVGGAAASRPGPVDYLLLAVLAAIWGASFLLIKIAVAEIPPLTLTAARLGCAVILLVPFAWLTGAGLPSNLRSWQLAVFVAALGTAFPFALISWGQQHIDSGITAIVLGIMPLTTMLLAHVFLPDDRMTVAKACGVVLGFAGVACLVGPSLVTTSQNQTGLLSAAGQLAIAGAALCYATSAIVTRRMMFATSQTALAAAVMLLAFAMITPIAVAQEGVPQAWPSDKVLIAMAVLGFVQTGLAQLILFKLIARQGPTFFSQINFIVPVVGVFWGAAILGERLPPTAFAALALILAGLAVARRRSMRH